MNRFFSSPPMYDSILVRRQRGLHLARQGRAELAEREYRLALGTRITVVVGLLAALVWSE